MMHGQKHIKLLWKLWWYIDEDWICWLILIVILKYIKLNWWQVGTRDRESRRIRLGVSRI